MATRSLRRIARGFTAMSSTRRFKPIDALTDHMGEHEAERGLDTGHAEGSKLELTVLLVGRVRRVIGDDGIDRAVGKTGAKRSDIGLRAKRRVHLVVRIVVLAD